MNAKFVLAAGTLTLALGGCAGAQAPYTNLYTDDEFTRIETGMNALLDAFEAHEEFPPGYTVTVATTDGRVWIRTGGTLREGSGLVAEPTSAFYIASMTKAYMGLLAAHLDSEGVLPLDTSLADYWPGLEMPGGLSASEVTLHDLITHQVPITAGEITGTEAYFRDLAPEEYPAYIETYAVPREPGFQYDNLGYNIYAAILEQETGKNWRDWLQEVIFGPNGMTGTSGRTSDFDPATVAWGHQLDTGIAPVWPAAEGWHLIPPKTDGMMQSAGGLMTTAEDLATWLRMNLTHEASGIDAETFARAQTEYAQQEGDGHGFSDVGYTYGWNTTVLIHERADASGEIPANTPLLQHGGGYTGYASLITMALEAGIGVAVTLNADGAAYFTAFEISEQLFELALGIQDIETATQNRASLFERVTTHFRTTRQERMVEALAEERWGDGGWTPDATTLDAYVGRYESEGWLPYVEITREGDILRARLYDAQRYVVPHSLDIFLGFADAAYIPEYFHFTRDEGGAVTGLTWDEDVFVKVSD